MEIRAVLSNYRVSAQKARLLADQVRGKSVDEAISILTLSTRGFAKPLAKLVRSALANAENKNNRDKAGIDVDNLIIGEIQVNEGSSMWRIRARAQGRASWRQKRTSNVKLVLTER